MLLGPNTNASTELLRQKCIICCGEDRELLLSAFADVGLIVGSSAFKFRCYEFWHIHDALLILTGIGTGCLEPLLWEIFSGDVIKQIILVGTAGRMEGSRSSVGQAYLVSQAWIAGTGLDNEGLSQPLFPHWSDLGPFESTTSVSTDFFYGFSPKLKDGSYPLSYGGLRRYYDQHVAIKTDLVEMEVGQFYAFCRLYPMAPPEFIAVKAVSNTIGLDDDQVGNSRSALTSTLKITRALLNL